MPNNLKNVHDLSGNVYNSLYMQNNYIKNNQDIYDANEHDLNSSDISDKYFFILNKPQYFDKCDPPKIDSDFKNIAYKYVDMKNQPLHVNTFNSIESKFLPKNSYKSQSIGFCDGTLYEPTNFDHSGNTYKLSPQKSKNSYKSQSMGFCDGTLYEPTNFPYEENLISNFDHSGHTYNDDKNNNDIYYSSLDDVSNDNNYYVPCPATKPIKPTLQTGPLGLHSNQSIYQINSFEPTNMEPTINYKPQHYQHGHNLMSPSFMGFGSMSHNSMTSSFTGFNPMGYNPMGYNPMGYNPMGYNPMGYHPMDDILGNTPGSFINMTNNIEEIDLIKITKIKMHDVLIGNDLYITSSDNICNTFLKQNILRLKIELKYNVDENTEEDMSDYLYGKQYRIMTGGATIHKGYLSYNSIFPVQHIPFDLVNQHEITIVIYDITEKNILDNKQLELVFTLNKSFKLHTQSYIGNVGDIPMIGINIPWNTIEYHGTIVQNSLRIVKGMCGRQYNDVHTYPDNYLKNNSTTLILKNGIALVKINKTLQHFVDNYCIDVAIQEICKQKYDKYLGKLLLIETLYFNKIKCNNCFKFYIPKCDTLTNLFITTQLNVNIISAELDNVILNMVEVQSDMNNTLKYKITNFDNISHYVCLTTNSILELKFSTKTKINLQYDRGSAQKTLRMALAKTSLNVSHATHFNENNPINLANVSFT